MLEHLTLSFRCYWRFVRRTTRRATVSLATGEGVSSKVLRSSTCLLALRRLLVHPTRLIARLVKRERLGSFSSAYVVDLEIHSRQNRAPRRLEIDRATPAPS